MSPEMLKECYNEKTDIWSLGVMMFELLSNKTPFDATSDQEVVTNILDGSYSF
jgi:serine/threonine protein kinase